MNNVWQNPIAILILTYFRKLTTDIKPRIGNLCTVVRSITDIFFPHLILDAIRGDAVG